MQFSLIAAVFSVLAASAQASPLAEANAVVTAKMTFTGQVTPGGPVKVLKGTAKEILEEVLRINPNYEKDFPATASAVEKRGFDGPPNCNFQGSFPDNANMDAIYEGLHYLQRLGNAKCGADAGPANCVRVSCSWRSGIFLCNDVSPYFILGSPVFGFPDIY